MPLEVPNKLTSNNFVTGLNIQHDANHGSVSRNPNVNWLLGLSENWIGGSQINWIHQHVVQHHLHTNDVHLDPDMASTSYVRLNIDILYRVPLVVRLTKIL